MESILNGPAPIGAFSKAFGSAKKESGSGAKAEYPSRTGRLETASEVVMVKVVSSTTLRPVMVLALGACLHSASGHWVSAYPATGA